MTTIYTGSDHTLTMNFKDSSDNPIDLDGADNITVKIFQQREKILAEYSLSGSTVEIVNANNGIARVFIQRDDLTAIQELKLYAEVWIDIENPEFEGGYKRSIVSDILLGQIKRSV